MERPQADRRWAPKALIYRAKDTDVARRALEDFDAGAKCWNFQVSGNRAELAAQLGACHPVLRLSRRCAAHHLHHERHRILERQTAARRANEGPFSNR